MTSTEMESEFNGLGAADGIPTYRTSKPKAVSMFLPVWVYLRTRSSLG